MLLKISTHTYINPAHITSIETLFLGDIIQINMDNGNQYNISGKERIKYILNICGDIKILPGESE